MTSFFVKYFKRSKKQSEQFRIEKEQIFAPFVARLQPPTTSKTLNTNIKKFKVMEKIKIILVLIADVAFRILIDKLNLIGDNNFLVDIYLEKLHEIAKKYGSLVDACKSINVDYYKLLDTLKL